MKKIILIAKALLAITLFAIAALAICIVFGEPIPGVEYSEGQFWWDKLASGCVLYTVFKVVQRVWPDVVRLEATAATDKK